MKTTKGLLYRTTLLALLLSASTSYSQDILWIRQFGTSSIAFADAVAADQTGVYVSGFVGDALPGQTYAGGGDAFVRKYSADGEMLWTKQFGTDDFDRARVAVHSSGVYAAGLTWSAFPAFANAGSADIFVRAFDHDGNTVWTQQFGSSGFDRLLEVTVGDSGVYIVGDTGGTLPGQVSAGGNDLFVARFDLVGNLMWLRQFGSPTDDPWPGWGYAGIATDATGVYVASSTTSPLPGESSLGGWDGFLRKYDFEGNVAWTRTISTSCGDSATSLAAANGSVFVGGVLHVGGDLDNPTSVWCEHIGSAAKQQSFIRMYDSYGNVIWTRQFSVRSGFLSVRHVALKDSTVYGVGIAYRGETDPAPGLNDPACPRGPWIQDPDVHVSAYNMDGTPLWTRQFGTPGSDQPSGSAADATGVYVAGATRCALAGQTKVGAFLDAFIVKLRR